MSTTTQSQADYLSVLGLLRPPFLSESTDDTYYEEPACKNCLDLLLHLGRYSELVLFVSGMLGSGKSTLLNQYRYRSGDTVFICKIDADTSLNEVQFNRLLVDGFNIPDRSELGVNLKDALQSRIEVIRRKSPSIVLLVDNIHKLSASIYDLLVQLANIKDEEGNSVLHIILFGESLAETKLKELFADRLKILKLSQYSLEDTSKYLQYRLNSAGFSDKHFSELFNSVSILNIYKLSNGLPARINKLAHNKLIEAADQKAPTVTAKGIKNYSKWQWLASGFVVVIVASAWFFQTEARELITGTQRKLDLVVVNLVKEFNSLSEGDITVESDDEKTKDNVGATASLVTNTLASVVNTENQALVRAGDVDSEGNEFVIDHTQIDYSINNSKDVLLTASKPVAVPVRVKEMSGGQAVQRNRNDSRSEPGSQIQTEQWLLAQTPNKYTIQIFGTNNEQDIFNLVKKYKLISKTAGVAYFRNDHKNTAWFSLVMGIYPDVDSANEAIKLLPATMTNDAWVRSYRKIQAKIRRIHPAQPIVMERQTAKQLTRIPGASNEAPSYQLKREEWLLSQDGAKYTLQLFGTKNQPDISNVVKKYSLLGDVAYYRANKKGGLWFGLTYGVYVDVGGARAAVKRLPGRLKKDAWIRKFVNIQSEIQKYNQN